MTAAPFRSYLASDGEKDVGGLDVPVHDPLLVHVSDRLAYLEKNRTGEQAGEGGNARGGKTKEVDPWQRCTSKYTKQEQARRGGGGVG